MRRGLLAAGLFASPAALACSVVGPEPLYLDPELADGVSPLQPEAGAPEVSRGRGPVRRGCMTSRTSCDDIGWLQISVTQPAGEVEDPVGYRWRVVEGQAPFDDAPPDGLPWLGPDLVWHWIDDAADDQEPLDFVLELTPVDAGGEEGPPVEVWVSDAGSAAGGCGEGAAALFLPLAAFLRRRYRTAAP